MHRVRLDVVRQLNQLVTRYVHVTSTWVVSKRACKRYPNEIVTLHATQLML